MHEDPAMKNYRLLLATAVALSVAGCSGDVTAPAPAVRAGDAVPASSTAAPEPQVISPVDPPQDETGNMGSGCCAKG
jgi:PBP1b-binding outer membrane lipoprotein LpoB